VSTDTYYSKKKNKKDEREIYRSEKNFVESKKVNEND